jgi:hypothetical protein
VRIVDYASLGVPLPFSSCAYIVAQSTDREMPVSTAGILWRRSVRRAEVFGALFALRDEDSGANGIARTKRCVIAGLDPAISMTMAWPCPTYRDDRDKPGHDTLLFDIVER